MAEDDLEWIKKLTSMRAKVNWENENERHQLLDRLYPMIKEWKGQLPALRDIFQTREIDWLLLQDAFNKIKTNDFPFIDFAIRAGYRDEPVLDQDGKLVTRRTTPVHLAAKRSWSAVRVAIPKLFEIFNNYEANYIDESGLTHFHVACEYGCEEVVEKFLELDEGLALMSANNTPLNLALTNGYNEEVIESLLRCGADPNRPDENGFAPLHVICKRDDCFAVDLLDSFLKINKDLNNLVQINVRDKQGHAPLHLALSVGNHSTAESLLTNDADPNMMSNNGSIALHLLCKRDMVYSWSHEKSIDMAILMFELSEERHRSLLVDARDVYGRTPLQWAVASLLPDMVEFLLNHGADLAKFIFPTEDYFAEAYTLEYTLQMAVFPAMTILKSLEKRGYKLNQDSALVIMKLFAKFGLVDEAIDIAERLRDDEEFARIAKKQMVRPRLTLYDFLRLPADEAGKIFSPEDYKEFTSGIKHLGNESHKAYITYLCQTVTREFFQRWTLKLFSKKSPWLTMNYLEMMIEQLNVKGLWEILMAAANESTQWLDSVRTDYMKRQYNRELSSSHSYLCG